MRVTVDAAELFGYGERVHQASYTARPLLGVVIAKTQQDVVRGAKVRSRVDVGTMQDGWTATPIESGAGGIHGDVTNPVDYTIHNEFGTWKMSAQPMAIPSLDEATPGFVSAVEAVIVRTASAL